VVGGGEEEDGEEAEEVADNRCQHETSAGNSENSANSSDLENSDDMLQDEEEDLIIDHTATSTYLSDGLGNVTVSGQNVHPCYAAEISAMHTMGNNFCI
jgi:hypothetical protein